MALVVKSIEKRDAGRGLAAIPETELTHRNFSKNDYILIENPRSDEKAIARVWPGYDEDNGEPVIRIDGDLRQKADVSIDDTVEITKLNIDEARHVSVELPGRFDFKGDIKPHILDDLTGKAAKAGKSTTIQFGFSQLANAPGQDVTIEFVETDPEGPVVVTNSTEIDIVKTDIEGGDRQRGAADEGDSVGSVTYEDIGGVGEELEQVREMIELPLQYPEVFQALGIEPPKGVLLHGPPGTGKTMIAKAVANEVDASLHSIRGPEVMSRYVGESSEHLRQIFEEAEEDSPAIIFMDEVDAIASDREEVDNDADQRVVTQLLSLMDGIEDRGDVAVIGATNRPDKIDDALRRGGRFDREIEVDAPDKDGRHEVLQIHTRDMPLTPAVDLERYAERTHGFVGADLQTLAKEAAMNAIRRIRPDIDIESNTIDARLLNSLEVRDDDFERALQEVEPSAMREVFVEVPTVSWNDVGGLEETKDALKETVQWPLEYDYLFDRVDNDGASGILLYGPPGTGKTLLAKAVANEAEANFISINGPEIMSKWVGESEERVREVFDKARSNAPAVVFFDEIDAIAGQRSGGNQSNEVSERVVSQLLTELDGLEALENVVVIATTNRPDLIDDALKRHGRFDKQIEVPQPDEETRRQIFEVHTKNKPLTSGVDLDKLAQEIAGYVGADIEAICEKAGMIAMREYVRNTPQSELKERRDTLFLRPEHFEQALEEVEQSVDDQTIADYDGL